MGKIKVSAVYQIINTVTGDRYVGSSNNVKRRWWEHKCLSSWKKRPNSLLYKDMQNYGLDKFRFQILAPVMPEYLTQVEQEFIEMLCPTYNNYRANGFDVERQKKYNRSERRKELNRINKHQLCSYMGETLTLDALRKRFSKAEIEHPFAEARKYLIREES